MTILWTLLKLYWKQALIVAGILFAIWWVYDTGYDRGHEKARIAGEKALAKYAQRVEAEYQKSVVKARAVEQQHKAEIAIISTAYEDAREEADAKARRTIADLRAGNLRLRSEWAACSSSLPGTSGDPGIPDAQDGLRQSGYERVLRIVGECQAQRDGLQAVVRTMTKQEFIQ